MSGEEGWTAVPVVVLLRRCTYPDSGYGLFSPGGVALEFEAAWAGVLLVKLMAFVVVDGEEVLRLANRFIQAEKGRRL